MRSKFVEVATKDEALESAPWAAEAIEVDGGYHVFESVADAAIWRANTIVEVAGNWRLTGDMTGRFDVEQDLTEGLSKEIEEMMENEGIEGNLELWHEDEQGWYSYNY